MSMLRLSLCVTALATVLTGSVLAQAPPSPSAAKRAVDERKAIFTLIGGNFRPIGEQLQGRVSLDSSQARKRAERLAFLAALASDAFSDVSNVGDPATRAKPEIWSNRAQFDQVVADFVKHSQALAQVVATQAPGSDAFKAAAGAVAQDCKSCHDNFRAK
ncbi:MAG: cytochrome c [Gammaproteobacteria bacterium]